MIFSGTCFDDGWNQSWYFFDFLLKTSSAWFDELFHCIVKWSKQISKSPGRGCSAWLLDLSRFLVLKNERRLFHTRKNTGAGRVVVIQQHHGLIRALAISLQVIWIGCADGRGLIVLVTEPLETIAVEVGDGVFHGWFHAILEACSLSLTKLMRPGPFFCYFSRPMTHPLKSIHMHAI